ncbi:MAG: hypothetical protein ABI679_09735 [Gemmatimonadota bacterium]
MDNIHARLLANQHAALVISHPGHELRVYGWMERSHPAVSVLTDGSGHTGASRFDSSTRIIVQAGAVLGPIHGALSDPDLYEAMLRGDHQVFRDLVDRLVPSFVSATLDYLVGDATEEYNPGHDACRLVIDAAVRLANQSRKVPLGNFSFRLTGSPAPEVNSLPEDLVELDDATLEHKLAAAMGYEELAGEVNAALCAYGRDLFRVEEIRPSTYPCWNPRTESGRPFYEAYGERQVAAGIYHDVLRYQEHMRPLADALAAYPGVQVPVACVS